MHQNTPQLDLQATADHIAASVPCRCCLGAIRALVQPALEVRGKVLRAGYVLVDCETPDCPMYRQTLAFEQWLTCDLSLYNASEHPSWEQAVKDTARRDTAKALVESLITTHETDPRIRAMVMADFHEQLRHTLAYVKQDVCREWIRTYNRMSYGGM